MLSSRALRRASLVVLGSLVFAATVLVGLYFLLGFTLATFLLPPNVDDGVVHEVAAAAGLEVDYIGGDRSPTGGSLAEAAAVITGPGEEIDAVRFARALKSEGWQVRITREAGTMLTANRGEYYFDVYALTTWLDVSGAPSTVVAEEERKLIERVRGHVAEGRDGLVVSFMRGG
jgi:hypothetical protein